MFENVPEMNYWENVLQLSNSFRKGRCSGVDRKQRKVRLKRSYDH